MIRPILKKIRRESDINPEVFIVFERRHIHSIFCISCGNYLIKKPISRNIHCFCDYRNTMYLVYKNFIETFSEDYGGDEIDDYLETSSYEGCHPDLIKYILNVVLFGETYQRSYHNNIDDLLTENILSFLV